MSDPSLSANPYEQPRVPPPPALPPTTTWSGEQPTEQRQVPGYSPTPGHFQWQVTNWQTLSESILGLYHYPTECREAVPLLREHIQLIEHPKLQLTEYCGVAPFLSEQGQFVEHGRLSGLVEGLRIQWERSSSEGLQHLVLKDLEKLYVFEDRAAVAAFIERTRLLRVLLEARDPLNAAFGEAAVKKLTLMEDDEGFETLFCLILIPGDMRQAKVALKSFDERWWLARSSDVGGKLNFDFELV
jgi:hypothetical protein